MALRYPKGEIVWVQYTVGDKVKFIITSKQFRDYYFLYESDGAGGFNKLGKSRSPVELEEKYQVMQKIRSM